jgi:eukaryotic-like serine/threonine-protein kinase
MKVCPNCQTKYPDDANFCPQETCATPDGPRRLEVIAEAQPPRYELEAQLGGARSGEVFRARDTQTGAAVAYKRVARSAVSTAAVLERSQRELKQLQRAQSPRLAKVLDFGKEPEGILFVVTELVDGQPLDRVVAASGAFPLERAKKVAAQIGEALLEGQKVGVVHHDLSAKNVLLMADDEVKLINFIAPCPVTDTVFGVPEYLSPEQAEGKLVDQRSNTYSLGAILTFMLTGKPPVEGADTAAVLEQILRGTPVPPSLRAPGLNAEIDRVLMKAMDRSPNRRPLTMRQFLTDVSGLVTGGSPTDSNKGVGFAKTMMFTGGSPEVQKLVNQALAARAEANGVAPAPGADPQATPPPMLRPGEPTLGPRRTHGAAIAATMISLPAVGSSIPGSASAAPSAGPVAAEATPPLAATPSPVAAAPAPSAGAGPSKPAGAAGAFRETLWFKQGDVDQMVADARAKLEASRGKAGAAAPEPDLPAVDTKPLEDRYVDDGTVTVDDRKAYSLRSGATSTALPTVGGVIPGERMSESEMIGEIGGGKRIGIIVAAAVVVLALIAALVVGFRHKSVAQSAAALTPVTVPTQPAAPPPPPAAARPAPPPPAPPVAAAPAAAPAAADDAAAAKPHVATHKHAAAAAKKAKGKKHR